MTIYHLGSIETRNCIVNANRSSTDDPRLNHADRCVVSLLVSIPSSFPESVLRLLVTLMGGQELHFYTL